MEFPEPVHVITTDIVMTADDLASIDNARGLIIRTTIRPNEHVRIAIIAQYDDELRTMAESTVITFDSKELPPRLAIRRAVAETLGEAE